ncbi:MAG: metallophosphoesterase [Rhodobacteraceae bacterium]|nr:metallophosphoesterase [Paracoccaceae bacterium]MCY4139472.1 metallophosphoesterase [Paracoccaceae bacterium]
MSAPVVHSARPGKLSTGIPAGTRICVIGDVHGRSAEFRCLLDHFAAGCPGHDRNLLILLGDLVDRGRDSLGALDTAIDVVDDPGSRGFDQVVPLMGNHEQMMRVTLEGLPEFDPWIWLDNGGVKVAEQLGCDVPQDVFSRQGAWRLDSVPPQDQINRRFSECMVSALGERRVRFLEQLRSHVRQGRLLFVHAGVDPDEEIEAFLALPWYMVNNYHWAWIRHSFLRHPEPARGLVVVHGHTPVRFDSLSETTDGIVLPHLLNGGKINLDGGSFVSGRVAGAEFLATEYRVTVAVGAPDRLWYY